MSVFDSLNNWRTGYTQRQRTREIDRLVSRRVNSQLSQVAEVVTSQVSADLLQEDLGWTRITSLRNYYDYSPAELQIIRARCLWLWRVSPIAAQRAFLLHSGTFGKGLSAPQCQDTRVQEVVDRFWQDDDNQLALFSRESLVLSSLLIMLEGERFFTCHTSPADSKVKLSDIPPAEIWTLVTHPQNRRKVVLYERRFRPQKWNFSTASYVADETELKWYYRAPRYMPERLVEDADDEAEALIASAPDVQENVCIYHLKGEHTGLRGCPEIYRAYDWIRSHDGVLSDLATTVKALAAFAFKKKLKTRSADALADAARMLASPPPSAGAVQIENQNVDLQAMQVNTGHVSNAKGSSREFFLQSIRDGGFGEHMYGGADTGNLATTNNMEMPAIWRIEDRQTLFEDAIRFLANIAIDRALAVGDFPTRRLPQSVDRDFQVDFPAAKPLSEQRLGTYFTGLVASVQAGIFPQQEAMRTLLLKMEVSDVDEIMEREFPKGERLATEPQTPGGPQAELPVPPGTVIPASGEEMASQLSAQTGPGTGPITVNETVTLSADDYKRLLEGMLPFPASEIPAS